MERRTGSFVAYDDQGQAETIFEYTDFVDASHFRGRAQVEGMKALRLANGDPVNCRKKGEDEVVATGRRLKSSAPDAP